MALSRPKICLLFSGGSTLINRDNKPIEVNAKKDITGWIKEVPELKVIADIDAFFVFDELTDQISPQVWSTLGQEIKKRYSQYDGFVITHDFSSIVYTGSALSYMLQNLGKPVVLTGSQESDNPKAAEKKVFDGFRRLGIRANLINAVQVATMDVAEVGIIFGNRFLRATQTQKTPTTVLNFYDSLAGYLGKVDFGIKLAEDRQRRRKTALVLRPEIEHEVFVLRLHPGIDIKTAINSITENAGAIYIQALDATLKDSDIKFLNKFGSDKNAIIFIQQRENKNIRANNHIVNVPSMFPEASLVKIMWALGQTNSVKRLQELMNENLANELITGARP